ncbi:hypothetical protein BT67DRAFT_228312 [Trichocladium antarcticum]|uniref:Uncharacterized protein n=1 Tax=Trichocladium antarcticum TaxID=1450529 RepID=A0AAN6UMX5_9PEZI|nr:hypothetical protein BT67DRAFT_228312 [Trichocladium antarcticum]
MNVACTWRRFKARVVHSLCWLASSNTLIYAETFQYKMRRLLRQRKECVTSCLFKTEKDSGRRVKTSDCKSTTCPNSSSYVKPTRSTSK